MAANENSQQITTKNRRQSTRIFNYIKTQEHRNQQIEATQGLTIRIQIKQL